jgi:hypothetical protein
MSLSWRLQRVALVIVTATILVGCGIGVLSQHGIPEISDSVSKYAKRPELPATEVARVSPLLIEVASGVNLQRMLPPTPIVPEPVPEAAPQVEAAPFQFSGVLVGTMVDSDPSHSYALIKISNGKIRLIRTGEWIDHPENQVELLKVSPNQICMKHTATSTEHFLDTSVQP